MLSNLCQETWLGNFGFGANLIVEKNLADNQSFICLDSLADNEPSARKKRN